MFRRLAFSVPVLLLALLVSGCIGPASPGAPSRPEGGAESEDTSASRNLWLLDAPRPFGGRVSGGAEPSILVDRAGGHVWIGDTSGLWRSSDGGATWRQSPDPFSGSCDGLALAQDDSGTLHVASTACTHIEYARSEDGGATWAYDHPLVDAAPVADRPWIAARGDGEVAILFYDFGRTLKESCVASRDDGRTWLDRSFPGGASPNAGNAVFDERGRLLYATADGVYRFSKACAQSATKLPLPASGAQIFTQLALDDAGRAYVAQPSPGNGAMEIRAFSDWRASTLRSLAVSPPELRSNSFGAISAHGDEVAVAWYGTETGGDPSAPAFDGEWNVFVTRVRDFWGPSPTVLHDRLTAEPNHVGDFCMGGVGCSADTEGTADRDLLDYFGVDHDAAGNLHIAYGHDGAGRASEVRYALLAR